MPTPDHEQQTLDTIEEVRTAAFEADGQDPFDEAASLRLEHRGLDGIDVWLADRGRGLALARGDELDLVVHPEHRGIGVGGDLLDRALTSTVTTAWSHGDHPAAARLARGRSFTAARALWVMRRPSSEPLPALSVPDDVEIRSFRPDDVDSILRVNGAAFASHAEQGAMDADDFAQRSAQGWFEPAGLLLALESTTGDLLGFHWTKRHDAHTGEVYVVAVSPHAQSRGIGRVLTLAGLHHLAGTDEVLLYVESDNETAISVYSGLGFEHHRNDTHVQYRRG